MERDTLNKESKSRPARAVSDSVATDVEEILPEARLVPRHCVVLTTYNNDRTLGAILRGVLSITKDVIVINNGSTDTTTQILSHFGDVDVVKFARNRGKDSALQAGFHHALKLGFTHAVTLDTNARYSPRDLPRMLQEMESHPESIIVGKRDWGEGFGVTFVRRLWRKQVGLWVFLATNHRPPDCASSFRVYPLLSLALLNFTGRRYDFDIEVLIKTQWIGVQVLSVPVRYRPRRGRISHFRPLRDGFATAAMMHKLLWQRMLLPPQVRRVMHLRTFAEMPVGKRVVTYTRGVLLQESGSPREIGLSAGIGVFLGIIPIWGLQTLAAIFVAQRMRLSKPLMIMASNIAFGLFFPLIIYASLLMGQLILSGQLDFSLELESFSREELFEYLAEYLIGSFVLGAICGIVAGFLSFQIASGLQGRK